MAIAYHQHGPISGIITSDPKGYYERFKEEKQSPETAPQCYSEEVLSCLCRLCTRRVQVRMRSSARPEPRTMQLYQKQSALMLESYEGVSDLTGREWLYKSG